MDDETRVMRTWAMAGNRMAKNMMKIVLEIAKSNALSDGNILAEEQCLICDLPDYVLLNDDKDGAVKASELSAHRQK